MKFKGFTLIELVFSIIITTLCMGILFSIYIRARNIAVRTLYMNELKSTGIMVLEEFKESIRDSYFVDTTSLKDIERNINDKGIINSLLYLKRYNKEPYILAVKTGVGGLELHRVYIDEVYVKNKIIYKKTGDNIVCNNIGSISIEGSNLLYKIEVVTEVDGKNNKFIFYISKNRGDIN